MKTQYDPGGVVSFRGRKYILFRRSENPGASYYVRVMHDGKRHLASTKTGDLTLAKAKAKGIIQEILDGKTVEKKPRGKSTVTIGKVIETFLAGDRYVRSRTADEYGRSLLRIVAEVKGIDKEAAKKVGVSELTDELARKYQALKQGGKSVDYSTPRKVNTGINTALRQARGLFSKKAMSGYERAGLAIPSSIQTFLKVPRLRELSHKYSDNPIPQEQIDKLNKDLPALKAQDDRLWVIHLMIRLMGLRNSEIERARRHWLVKRGEATFLVINRREGEEAPKRSDGEVPVPKVLLDWFAKSDDDFLIPAKTPNERYELIRITHSKWVGERVPGREKTNHELRKWAGSVVATKTNSWERAAEFLRIDLETAKQHYLAFVTPSEPLSLQDLLPAGPTGAEEEE